MSEMSDAESLSALHATAKLDQLSSTFPTDCLHADREDTEADDDIKSEHVSLASDETDNINGFENEDNLDLPSVVELVDVTTNQMTSESSSLAAAERPLQPTLETSPKTLLSDESKCFSPSVPETIISDVQTCPSLDAPKSQEPDTPRDPLEEPSGTDLLERSISGASEIFALDAQERAVLDAPEHPQVNASEPPLQDVPKHPLPDEEERSVLDILEPLPDATEISLTEAQDHPFRYSRERPLLNEAESSRVDASEISSSDSRGIAVPNVEETHLPQPLFPDSEERVTAHLEERLLLNASETKATNTRECPLMDRRKESLAGAVEDEVPDAGETPLSDAAESCETSTAHRCQPRSTVFFDITGTAPSEHHSFVEGAVLSENTKERGSPAEEVDSVDERISFARVAEPVNANMVPSCSVPLPKRFSLYGADRRNAPTLVESNSPDSESGLNISIVPSKRVSESSERTNNESHLGPEQVPDPVDEKINNQLEDAEDSEKRFRQCTPKLDLPMQWLVEKNSNHDDFTGFMASARSERSAWKEPIIKNLVDMQECNTLTPPGKDVITDQSQKRSEPCWPKVLDERPQAERPSKMAEKAQLAQIIRAQAAILQKAKFAQRFKLRAEVKVA